MIWNGGAKQAVEFDGWLVDRLGRISPSFLDEEIPERDLARALNSERKTAWERANAQATFPKKPTSKRGSRWSGLDLAVVSGFAAASSAAWAGAVVFAFLRNQ